MPDNRLGCILLLVAIISPVVCKNLILGAEYNIRAEELRIFLASLRASGCDADVILFSGRYQEHTQRLADRFGATVIMYDFALLNRTHGPVGVHRFRLYRQFLEERIEQYDHVLHTDVRDVMFQDDPFARIDSHGGGVFFLESNHLLIGTSPTNRGWMTENCSVFNVEKMLERTSHRLRCCSGNMYGTAQAVYWYAKLMEDEQQRTASVTRDKDGNIVSGGWCADQAVQQALLWTGKFSQKMNVTTYFNEDGPLCTMGDVVSISVDEFGEVRNSNGELYAVVHQYDRHKRVKDLLAARFDEEDAPSRIHPSFDPNYQDRLLYGNPNLIVRHETADVRIRPEELDHDSPAVQKEGEGRREEGGREKGMEEEACLRESTIVDAEVRSKWEELVAAAPPEEAEHVAAIGAILLEDSVYPEIFSGRGVVMAAGGRVQVANAYVTLRRLREVGCWLPVELFYADESEMSAEVVELLERMEVMCYNVYHLPNVPSFLPLRGFQIKAFAVVHSSFEEVIWLDSDVVPLRNPQELLSSALYSAHGSIFWQDWSRDPHWISREFLAAYGLRMHEGERELEAGQFAVSKRRTWRALKVVIYINSHFLHFYRRMYGDKDSWRIAFKLAGIQLGRVPRVADAIGRVDPSGRFCGNTMMHFLEERPMFLHRTLQTLIALPTPLPGGNQEELEGVVAGYSTGRAWQLKTVGGRQAIAPRLDPVAGGWRVEKEEEDEKGSKHWCLYVEGDEEVSLAPVEEEIAQLEQQLKAFLQELLRTGKLATLPSSSLS